MKHVPTATRAPVLTLRPAVGSNRTLEDNALPLLDDVLSRLRAEFPKYKFRSR